MGRLLLNQEFNDIDELGAAAGWELDFRQLDRGMLRGSITAVGNERSVLMRFDLNRAFHQRGGPIPGMKTFGLPDEGIHGMRWHGNLISSPAILDFNSNDGFDSFSPAGLRGFTFSLTDAVLNETAEAFGMDPDEIFDSIESCWSFAGDNKIKRLRANFVALMYTATHSESTLQLSGNETLDSWLATQVVDCISSVKENPTDLTAEGSASICRQAIEYIDTYACDAVTVKDVCQTLGVSISSMERAFRKHFETSPKRYILNTRLNGVRRELMKRSASSAISDIANAWGFWHLGQFAADYQRMFGELPSQVKARKAKSLANRLQA